MEELPFKIVMRKVDDLIPYIKNPKDHPPDQVDRIARSILRFGWLKNIVIDKDNEIIAGHGSILAARMLGINEVPCRIADHLDEAETKAARLADNETAEADWLYGYLSDEVKDLYEISIQMQDDGLLQSLGFSEEELDKLMVHDKEPTAFLDDFTKTPKDGDGNGKGEKKETEGQTFFPMVILLTFKERTAALLAIEHAKMEADLDTQMQAVHYMAQDYCTKNGGDK